MIMNVVIERSAKIIVPDSDIPEHARAVGFYNPAMKTNRDISVAVAKSFVSGGRMFDAFTATGIRAIRYYKEVGGEVHACDVNPRALELAKKNAKMNGAKIIFHAADWRTLNEGFDLIDIDPYGSPVGHVSSAFRKIRRGGLLFVTATDVATLNGVYPKTCMRRYWAKSARVEWSKELATRILLSFVMREGLKYDRAFEPILSYQERHYVRVLGRVLRGASKSDKLLNSFKRTDYGFIYMGKLHNLNGVETRGIKILEIAKNEIDVPFYRDVHVISKKYKCPLPKIDDIIERLERRGFKASRTVFSPTGIKTDANEGDIVDAMKGE